MKKNEIRIIVAGPAGIGKTTLIEFLTNVLGKYGIPVNHISKIPQQYCLNPSDLDKNLRSMSAWGVHLEVEERATYQDLQAVPGRFFGKDEGTEEKPESILDGLIQKANAGRHAVDDILKQFPGRLQRKFKTKDWHDMNSSSGVQYRATAPLKIEVSQKRAGGVPITQQHSVSLTRSTITIGCQSYERSVMMNGLHSLLLYGVEAHPAGNKDDSMKAFRGGVRIGQYSISWDEADKLRKVLEKN